MGMKSVATQIFVIVDVVEIIEAGNGIKVVEDDFDFIFNINVRNYSGHETG